MQTTDEDRKALEKAADAISWQPSLGQGHGALPRHPGQGFFDEPAGMLVHLAVMQGLLQALAGFRYVASHGFFPGAS